MDWSAILAASIPASLVFLGVVVSQSGKRGELRDTKYQRLEERVDHLENRLNEEARSRRQEQNFSHILVMDVYTAIQTLEAIRSFLEDYADILPAGSPAPEQVQEIIEKLEQTIALRPGFNTG